MLKEISAQESGVKLEKVIGKTPAVRRKMQFNLHDGRNMVTATAANVGDSFLISLPEAKIKKVLPLKNGAKVFLTKGKHAGNTGLLKESQGQGSDLFGETGRCRDGKKLSFVVRRKKKRRSRSN